MLKLLGFFSFLGQKRKVRSIERKENTDVVQIKTESLEKSPKCRKISSDDDFIKPPSRRSQGKSKVNTVTSDVVNDSGTEIKCLRKSRRLQEKSVADDIDKQVCIVKCFSKAVAGRI